MLTKTLVGLIGIVSQSRSLSVSRPATRIESRQDLGAPCLEITEARQNSLLVATTNILLESPEFGIDNLQTCPEPLKEVTVSNGSSNIGIGLYFNVSCQHTPVLGYKPAASTSPNDHVNPYMVEDVYKNLLYSDSANRSQQIQRGAQDFLNYWDAKAKVAFGEEYNQTFKGYSPLQGNFNVSIIASSSYDGGYAYALTAKALLEKISRENSTVDTVDAIASLGLPRKRNYGPRINGRPPDPFPPRFSGSTPNKDPQLMPETVAIATSIFVRTVGESIMEYAKTHDVLDAYEVLVLNTALAAFTNAVSFEKDPDLARAKSQPLPVKEAVDTATAAIFNDQIVNSANLTRFAPGMTGARAIAKEYYKLPACPAY